MTSSGFITSQPFRFLIGPDNTAFHIHIELVAKQSEALAMLVSGPMSEAKERCALLEDVDENTFAQFTEYMYTSDYSVPDPEIESEPAAVEDLPALAEDDLSRSFRSQLSKKGKKKSKKLSGLDDEAEVEDPLPEPGCECKRDEMWSAFRNIAYVQHREPWEPRKNEDPCEDYTQVFLCHSRLYALSDRYYIEPLQKLTLQKSRLTLSRFHLFSNRVPDIVELVRYTYANTVDYDEGTDKLRSLVLEYVVCHFERIFHDQDFKNMVQEPGELAKDLMERYYTDSIEMMSY